MSEITERNVLYALYLNQYRSLNEDVNILNLDTTRQTFEAHFLKANYVEIFMYTLDPYGEIDDTVIPDDGDDDALSDDREFDESMDGDFDSAMVSAGHGTDEDYGYYGD